MGTDHFIAWDVHCAFTEMVAMTTSGRIVRRERCETAIPALVEALEQVRRPRLLTFEEGPLAGWLARNIAAHVDQLLVCEPRRNRLIAKESDKDDPLDAEKLAHLFRGGYLKEVHHPQNLERALLKEHVAFYYERVRERVRLSNQILGHFRQHGVFAKSGALGDPDELHGLLRRLPAHRVLRGDVALLLAQYELLVVHEEQAYQEFVRLARREEPVRRFEKVPGFGWIRALTYYVYLDTPWRFRSKAALWRYCGIGLERRHSGSGPVRSQLDHRGNRRLKNILLGAARSAIASTDNPFAEKYRYWTEEEGMPLPNARRNVARSLATTLWSLWKTDHEYDSRQVRGVGLATATDAVGTER
jgi:transposase